jgi:hypothetical protein
MDRLAFAFKGSYRHTPAAGTWFWLERGSRQGGAVVLWCCGAVVLWFIAIEKHLQ